MRRPIGIATSIELKHLEVEMRTRGVSSISRVGYQLSSLNMITNIHRTFSKNEIIVIQARNLMASGFT